jgi:phytoene dehydrogenase-like protein
VANYQVAEGGSIAVAYGLMHTFVAAGGELKTGAHVARIIVDQNQARGVELADGTQIRSRFVASTVDVPQTFATMVGEEQLPEAYREKVRNFKQTAWSLFGLHLALKEAPRHVGTDFDPHVNNSLKVNVGCESVEQLFALHDQVAKSQIPARVSFGTGSVTQFDPSQAPPGMATAYAWHAMPYAPGGDPENIEAVKEEFADRMLETWREWAPNVTADNILARHIWTANDYAKELIDMVRGDIFIGSFSGDQTMWNHFGYRTPVDGLYMAGSATHPGGAISGGGGYIAAKIIAGDLQIPLWWEPMDARASLRKLAENA